MENKLYLECYSGISGDMTVAALLDLGADKEVLNKALASLPVQGFNTQISRVVKSGIDACDFNVILEDENDNHDHDMKYLYGHVHDGEETHVHRHGYTHTHYQAGCEHNNDCAHQHNQDHHNDGALHKSGHHHEHRGMKEIRGIIEQGDMTNGAKNLAFQIFNILAEAESKAHNVPIEQVHFHEVGAVDSIVDIVSVAVCMDNLNITEVIVPELYEGKGTVRCQHGILPVPVPAVVNIMQAYSLNIRIMDKMGEFITPTGAAIVAAVKTSDMLPKRFRILQIGIGAGKREYNAPGILRAMLIEEIE